MKEIIRNLGQYIVEHKLEISFMNKILFILSLIVLVSCNNGQTVKHEQPQTILIQSDNIQYDINWKHNDVDIRIITLTKDGNSHDFVVATSYVYKGGGIDINHWPGCKCMKINNDN